MDFWISDWISGFHSGFLDFSLDFWISGFQFGFLQTVYEISFVTDPSHAYACYYTPFYLKFIAITSTEVQLSTCIAYRER